MYTLANPTQWYANPRKFSPGRIAGLGAWYDSSTTSVYSDGAVQFTAGDKGYLTIADASQTGLDPGTSDFSYSFWVNPTTLPTIGILIDKSNGGSTGYILYHTSTGALLCSMGDGTNASETSEVGVITTGSWQNFTVVVNRTGNMYVYKNGNTSSPVITVDVSARTGNINSTAAFSLGGYATNTTRVLNAAMDSVGFWNKALSAAEVASLYNSGAGKIYSSLSTTELTNLISWWDMNESEGSRYDSKGTNHLSQAFNNIIDNTSSLGTELVTNGGFDSNTTGWTAGNDAVLSSESGGQSGNCLKILNNVTNYGYAYQAITTVANQNYTISFYQKNGTSGALLYIGTAAGTGGIYYSTTGISNADWTLQTRNFKATGTTTVISLLVNSSGDTDYTLIDTVSVKALTQTNLNGGFESLGTGETLGSELLSNTGFETSGTNGGLKSGVAIVNVARASNVATIEATGHGLSSTNVATITGVTTAGFDATGVTVTVLDADHFTYPNTGSDVLETADATGKITTDVFANWSETEGGGLITKTTALVKSGTYAALLTQSSGGSGNALTQTIVVTASTRYKLTFYAAGDGTNAGRYGLYDVSNSADIVAATSTAITAGAYSLITKYFTTPTGCTSLRVNLYPAAVASAYAYFDDVSVKQVTASNTFLNWTDGASGSSTIQVETTNPYAGTNAYSFTTDSAGSFVGLQQNGLITAGHKYKATCYARSASGTPSAKFIIGTTEQTISTTTTYALATAYKTADTTTFSIARSTTGSAYTIYIDDVTLVCTEIPSAAGIAAGLAIDGNLCASFNGSTQYLSKTNDAKLQTGDIDFTVWGWMNLSSYPTGVNFGAIAGKYYLTGDQREYVVIVNASGVPIFYISPDGTSGTAANISWGTAIPVNTWAFVVAWHDATANTINIQVNDGTAQSTAHTTGAYSGTGAFSIGAYAGGTYPFPGRIDDVGFIKRTLTDAEKTAIFYNGKGVKYAGLPSTVSADSTLCYWNLDEFSAGTGAVTRYDSTSNDMDLTDNGTTPSGQGVNYYEGAVSDWYDISGNAKHLIQVTQANKLLYRTNIQNSKPVVTGDSLTKSAYNAADLIGTGDVTIFAVIKPRGFGGGGYGSIINNSKFVLYVNDTLDRIFASSDGGVNNASSANSSIVLNTSYVIAVTRTSAGVVNIYINGVISGSADQASGTPAAGTPTYIGNSAAGTRGFDGDIDEIAIYSGILTTAQITAVTNYMRSKWSI